MIKKLNRIERQIQHPTISYQTAAEIYVLTKGEAPADISKDRGAPVQRVRYVIKGGDIIQVSREG